ncbi:MAG: hypothetical protein KF691_08640 [Phycisphaeraceae bacterium]|nr:hypothetical protein [Phycisphaeraceae bacterium]
MTSTERRGGSLMADLESESRDSARKGPQGRTVGTRMLVSVALAVLSLFVLGYVVYSTFRGYANDPRRQAFFTVVADSETGEVDVHFPLPDDGRGYPAVNPKTGKRTLYPAESCYWTKDGKAKLDPTYVILNGWFEKPGPTKCPDCGRTVTKSNRMPPDALMQKAWDAAESAKKR